MGSCFGGCTTACPKKWSLCKLSPTWGGGGGGSPRIVLGLSFHVEGKKRVWYTH